MKAHLFLVALFFQTVLGVPDENGEASFVNWQGSGYYWSPCKFDYPRIPRYEALPVCKNNYLPVENANNGYATRAKQAEYGNGRHRCSDVPDETHYFCALPSKYTKAYWEGNYSDDDDDDDDNDDDDKNKNKNKQIFSFRFNLLIHSFIYLFIYLFVYLPVLHMVYRK